MPFPAPKPEVHARQPRGTFTQISEADVGQNAARNLSRQPEKATATQLLAGSIERMRDATRSIQLGFEPSERRQRRATSDARARQRAGADPDGNPACRAARAAHRAHRARAADAAAIAIATA